MDTDTSQHFLCSTEILISDRELHFHSFREALLQLIVRYLRVLWAGICSNNILFSSKKNIFSLRDTLTLSRNARHCLLLNVAAVW